MKEDRYEFPTSEWMFAVREEEPRGYILYRKKPKVDDRENTPVKVELDELFGVDVRRRADYYRAFNEKGNQLEGDKSLQRVCAYLLRAYDPQPFILKAHTFEDGGDVEIAEMRVRINPITVEIVEDK